MRILVPFFFVWTLLSSIDSLNLYAQTAEELVVGFATHIDKLKDTSFGTRVYGYSIDSGGSRPMGKISYHGAYLQNMKEEVIYTRWGTQFEQRPQVDSSIERPVSEMSVDPSTIESKRFKLPNQPAFYRRRMLNGDFLLADETKEKQLPNTLSSNFGLLGLMAFPSLTSNTTTSDQCLSMFLNLEFKEERKTKSGETVGTWTIAPAKVSEMEITFGKDSPNYPIKFLIKFLDRPDKGLKPRTVWESEIEWIRVGDDYFQKATVERNYFPDGMVMELLLEYEWILETTDTKFDFVNFEKYGWDTQANDVDVSTNWQTGFNTVVDEEKLIHSTAKNRND